MFLNLQGKIIALLFLVCQYKKSIPLIKQFIVSILMDILSVLDKKNKYT